MRGLSIGRLAAKTGVNFETIRYYERIGLMPTPSRTEGGHRTYADSDVRRLSFIRRARHLGFALADIGTMLMLEQEEAGTCAQVKAIAARHLEDVEKKIRQLERLRETLAATISECDADPTPSCAILEALEGRPCDAKEG